MIEYFQSINNLIFKLNSHFLDEICVLINLFYWKCGFYFLTSRRFDKEFKSVFNRYYLLTYYLSYECSKP